MACRCGLLPLVPASPAAFLERVNGKAIVPGEGDAIVVSDDVACGTLGCGGL